MTGSRRWTAQQITVLSAVVLCCLTATGALGSLVVGRQLKLVTRQLRAEQQLLAHELTLGAEIPGLQAAAETLRGQVGSLEPTVAPEQYLPTLISQLSELADQHHLRLVGTTPAAADVAARLARPNEPAPVQRHRLEARFAGRYPDLMELVDGLQRAPKALALAALRIEADGAAGSGEIVAVLSLVADPAPGILRPEDEPEVRLAWSLFDGLTGAPQPFATAPRPAPEGDRETPGQPDLGLPEGPGYVAPPAAQMPWNVQDKEPATAPAPVRPPVTEPGETVPTEPPQRPAEGQRRRAEGEAARRTAPAGGEPRERGAETGAAGQRPSGEGQRPGGERQRSGGGDGTAGQGQRGSGQGGAGRPGGQGGQNGQGRQRPAWMTPEMMERMQSMTPEERREFFQKMRAEQGADGGGQGGSGRRSEGDGRGGQGGGLDGPAADLGLVF